jgi:hypothetical protein
MKLRNYRELFNEGSDDELQDEYTDYFGEEDEESMYDDSDQSDSDQAYDSDDVLEHLASLIRQMIKMSNIENFYVTTDEYDISIQFVLNKTERFNKLMKIMGLLKKLTTDTLIQYESQLELWETKEGLPLLTIDFYYDDKKIGTFKKNDDLPF